MRAHHRLQRLFVPDDLSADSSFELDKAQSHYLANVMRMKEGGELLVFNGKDGEWLARVDRLARKSVTLSAVERTRAQPPAPDLLFAFAPIKAGRLDYLVQKAVEMGAGPLQPVITQHTQMSTVGTDRLQANAIEAAEQCGILSVPRVLPAIKFDRQVADWQPERRLVFCDESAGAQDPLQTLAGLRDAPLGLLVGPEGGFSDEERRQLHRLPFVTVLSLGPRILRADTAAVAALALIQATVGDWRIGPPGTA